MFTGIIEAVGNIQKINPKSGDFELVVDVNSLDMSDVKLGDSIAVNGVCLTVTQFSKTSFNADVSAETIRCTKLADLTSGSKVNLEKACRPDSRLGGHIVSGHVDAVGRVESVLANANATDYWISAPDEISHYIAEKGSITVDGISLTVNQVEQNQFRLTIIPHTTEQTNILDWVVGAKVNLEVDVIARYLERLMTAKPKSEGVTMELLAKSGFLK
ncbi:riboflavin synthase [Catenovulum maritimum]|uniref:Riboflavin synthase n=1 Tax=Catenovulum maritimum TaxID=1513271 RepID=A0A0J8GR54_9ALTE|nr:riboflavin synthase [Catenovulum maritimum]KMT65192.1 riboflavin synthase subunit alpha [Catenovulum maritimum]